MKKKELSEQELLSNQVKILSGMLIRYKEDDVKECFSKAGISLPSYRTDDRKSAHPLEQKLYS